MSPPSSRPADGHTLDVPSEQPRVDYDTAALIERAQVNAARSAYDLEEWILSQVRPAGAMRVLDLGCGTGKQLFALADAAPTATCIGLDMSEDAVAAVNERSARNGTPNVRAVRAELDGCIEFLAGHEPFDLILSSYAIYYATDMPGLLQGLAGLLAPHGQFFFCGPGRGTNQELIDLVNGLQAGPGESIPAIDDFIDEATLDELRNVYEAVAVSRLANTVTFVSAEEVLTWWRNHKSYRTHLENDVTKALERRFGDEQVFKMSKNVLGVHCRAQ